jgi:hypothetical protein
MGGDCFNFPVCSASGEGQLNILKTETCVCDS